MNETPIRKTLAWRCCDRIFEIRERPLLMGVVNVTPDSFSDGGRYVDPDRAVAHALQLVEDGADIVDVGGESTRPGAAPVTGEEEGRRILPVVARLARECGAAISVDTRKATVAERALAEGASIVNDVSALTQDPRMPEVAREFGAGVILMHMRGEPRTMQEDPRYGNVIREVSDYLAGRVGELVEKGLRLDTLAIDPGVGFGKTLEHNVQLLAGLDEMCAGEQPVVVGLSRKSFLGKLTGREVDERLAASLAGLAFCVLRGAHVLRVHDVLESWDVGRVLTALTGGAPR